MTFRRMFLLSVMILIAWIFFNKGIVSGLETRGSNCPAAQRELLKRFIREDYKHKTPSMGEGE